MMAAPQTNPDPDQTPLDSEKGQTLHTQGAELLKATRAAYHGSCDGVDLCLRAQLQLCTGLT
jgi:hypothetical protein